MVGGSHRADTATMGVLHPGAASVPPRPLEVAQTGSTPANDSAGPAKWPQEQDPHQQVLCLGSSHSRVAPPWDYCGESQCVTCVGRGAGTVTVLSKTLPPGCSTPGCNSASGFAHRRTHNGCAHMHISRVASLLAHLDGRPVASSR